MHGNALFKANITSSRTSSITSNRWITWTASVIGSPKTWGNGDYVNWTTKEGQVEETWSNRGFWNENSTTSGHAINKTGSVSGDKTAADVCAPYYMRTFYNEDQQGIEEAESNVKSHKIVRDGQLFIERNGKVYTVDGRQQ